MQKDPVSKQRRLRFRKKKEKKRTLINRNMCFKEKKFKLGSNMPKITKLKPSISYT